METIWIDRGTRRLHAIADRAGEGLPWVVFSNSLLTDTGVWQGQVAALAGRFNLLRYDQYGHGLSDAGLAEVSLDGVLAEDLIAVIDHLGLTGVTFAGVSMGVPTALAACARRPELFGRMILVNGQVQSSPDGQEVWAQRVQAARDIGLRAFSDATMRRWMAAEAADGAAGEALLEMMAATPFEGFAACALALGKFDCRAGLEQLPGPVLAVAGRNDQALTQHMTAVFGGMPGVRFEVIEGAGHLANYEAPAAFNALVDEFLG